MGTGMTLQVCSNPWGCLLPAAGAAVYSHHHGTISTAASANCISVFSTSGLRTYTNSVGAVSCSSKDPRDGNLQEVEILLQNGRNKLKESSATQIWSQDMKY